MKKDTDSLTLRIPKSIAVELADGMEIAEHAIECMREEGFRDATNAFLQLRSSVAEQSGVTADDLEAYASALRRTAHLLGKELPKYFPELSRAAQRGHVDEDDMGFI